jgi:arabinose-5-phosphate isomerase
VFEAVNELNDKNLGAVLIVNDGHLLQGILTDGDVRRFMLLNQKIDLLELGKVMTAAPVTINSGLMAADALSIMQRHEVTVLPVIDDTNRLLGILHLHELLGKGEFRFLI